MIVSLPLPGHRGRLDEQDLAADRRPGQPGRHAGLLGAAPLLGEEARACRAALARACAEIVTFACRLALGDLASDLAADRADLALQVSHPGLARVLVGDRPKRRVAERDLASREPVLLDLAGDQVALGDVDLLVERVAGEVDHLHPVLKRPGTVSSVFAVVMNITSERSNGRSR